MLPRVWLPYPPYPPPPPLGADFDSHFVPPSQTNNAKLRQFLLHQPQQRAPSCPFRNYSTIVPNKETFHVILDVKHFSVKELAIRVCEGIVTIEGKHEEKMEIDCVVARTFLRRYALPEGCDEVLVESSISTDGILTIIAPKNIAGRNVKIKETGTLATPLPNNQFGPPEAKIIPLPWTFGGPLHEVSKKLAATMSDGADTQKQAKVTKVEIKSTSEPKLASDLKAATEAKAVSGVKAATEPITAMEPKEASKPKAAPEPHPDPAPDTATQPNPAPAQDQPNTE